jgi:ABC-type Co2+ transport system permease subunit
MKQPRHSRAAVALLAVTLLAPWFAQAQNGPEEPSMLAMTGDLLIARPVGLVTTVAGAAVFLVSLPFTALGGNVAEAADTLVIGPARTTFVRCLGCEAPRVLPSDSHD